MKIENLCICYASTYHLSLILVEYLKNRKDSNIITFFEKGIDDEVKSLIEKYNIQSDAINKTDFNKTINIQSKNIELTKDNIFIVRGDIEYINFIIKYLKENYDINNTNSKIIKCYDFQTQIKFMDKILKENDKIIFTNGEHKINKNGEKIQY